MNSFIGNQPATSFESPKKQVSTSNSGTTITLDYPVTSVADIRLTINAVVQSYDNYSVSGSTLTVGGTLNNDRVEILFVGRTYGSIAPSDASVVTSALQDGAVTNVKLGTDINATKLTAGLVPTARLGSGTASSSTILYGDQTYKTAPSGANPTHIARIENDSDVSSLTFTNCFSSTYDVYKVVFYIGTTQANGDLHLRFRKNTSDDFTGTDLNGNMFGEIGTTSPTHFDNGGVASSTYLSLSNNDVYSGASSGLAGEILIAYPYLRSNNRIHISYQGVADGSSGVTTYVGGWVYSGSEVATGIQFWSGSGSTRFRKSEINVYGYNK